MYKKIKIIHKLCVIVITSLFFTTCDNELFESNSINSNKGTLALQNPKDLELSKLFDAQNFYSNYQQPQLPKSRSLYDRQPLVKSAYFPYTKDEPSWKYYTYNRNDTLEVFEVDLTDRITQDYILKENWEAYKKYKQHKYLRSYTRYVYTRHLKKGTEEAFYMTIVPTVNCVRNFNNKINKNTYLKRNKYLSGYVLFHTLYGAFINGWEYKEGEITGKVLSSKVAKDFIEKKPLILGKINSSYEVAPKMVARSLETSHSEESEYDNNDDTYDGGSLPELEVTPETDPSDDYDWSNDIWDDWLTPDIENDEEEEEPVVVPDSGMGGGSGAITPTAPTNETLPKNLKKFYDINKSNLTLNQVEALSEIIDIIKMDIIGEKICAILENTSVAFVIDSTIDTPGQFDRFNNIITVKYASYLSNSMYIFEELVHVVQDEKYYDTMGAYANFEFEAKTITDISIGCGSIGTYGIDDENYCEKYTIFINSIVKGNWEENTWLNQYNELQDQWYNYQKDNSTNYSKMSLSSTISPKALDDFIKLYKNEE